MLDVFETVKGLTRLRSDCIDNAVFRLHYRVSVLLLVAFSIIVTKGQFFGDPIDCMQAGNVPQKLMDTYCWIHSTFTLPDAWDKRVGEEVAYPGVDTYQPGDVKTYQKYYQWVCFVLFLQAIMFYIPRYVWKVWEGGKVKSLVMELHQPVLDEPTLRSKKTLLVQYLKTHLGQHMGYLARYVVCEVLNLGNVVGQMYLLNKFLDGEFSNLGLEVVAYSQMEQEDRTDPMIRVFPRMTKCTFRSMGSSGDIQNLDTLCMLPLNIINEKIYIFLWFWFVLLAFLSSVVLIYRVVVIASSNVRLLLLRFHAGFVDPSSLKAVLKVAGVGDWFLLYLLSKNVESVHFREVMKDLMREMEDGHRMRQITKQMGDDV